MTSSDSFSNPVIAGFAPDPSVLRVGSTYYLATSTSSWLPGIRIYSSTDLADWTLTGHALTEWMPDVRGVPANAGVWAPDLSFDSATGMFTLVYSIMWSMTAEVFDLDNFVITAEDPAGPWSEPVYLNSLGFDPSLFHDDDGRHWMVTLEWDPRTDYQHPGAIVLEEYDPVGRRLVGPTTRISRGSTDRGCLEAPHLYKRNGFYYLMTAEGGTGFGHCVAFARSERIEGPYTPAPNNPIITSAPDAYFDRNNPDYLRPERFNPHSVLQKSGHGALVDTPAGEWFVAHLGARPAGPERRSMLGRETFVQHVEWTDDGWLTLVGGGRLAEERVPGIAGTTYSERALDDLSFDDDFDASDLDVRYMTSRTPFSDDWGRLDERPGHLRLRGRHAPTSRYDVSLIAVPLKARSCTASTVVEIDPRHFSQSAGLALYYDEANHIELRVYASESLASRAVGIVIVELGERRELRSERRAIGDGPVRLEVRLDDGVAQCWFAVGDAELEPIGPAIDATVLSDEATRGFTGATVALVCQDSYRRDLWADFDSFRVAYASPGTE